MPKRALITGVSGQDGSYLAELLLQKGYDVTGTVRESARDGGYAAPLITTFPDRFRLACIDLLSLDSLRNVLKELQPDEIYHLAAATSVAQSFEQPDLVGEITGVGAVRVFEAVRRESPHSRVFFASSSQIFGNAKTTPQDESTPWNPNSPYSAAKAYAHHMARIYRDVYGIFIAIGILYNHDSPRRGPQFVSSKITQAAVRIAAGQQEVLTLGNLNAARDWGFAGDFVQAMWLMLQHDKPDEFIVATGQLHTVRELCSLAFAQVGLPLTWSGAGIEEVGRTSDGTIRVVTDPQYYRPTETSLSVGNSAKAHRHLGWSTDVPWETLIASLVHPHRKASPPIHNTPR